MRYKIPAQYFDRPVDEEAAQFFSAIVGYSTSNFIPAQRDAFRLWQLAFNRTLKFAPKCVPVDDSVVADADLLLYFYSHFAEPHSEHKNVSLLHPPAVFEKNWNGSQERFRRACRRKPITFCEGETSEFGFLPE